MIKFLDFLDKGIRIFNLSSLSVLYFGVALTALQVFENQLIVDLMMQELLKRSLIIISLIVVTFSNVNSVVVSQRYSSIFEKTL